MKNILLFTIFLFISCSSDRERIENRYACESSGHSVGQGTPNQQNPIGLTCP